jgi:hypothetical protein
VRIIEELLERAVAAPVYKTEINGHGDFFYYGKKYCKYKKVLGNAHPAEHTTPSIR